MKCQNIQDISLMQIGNTRKGMGNILWLILYTRHRHFAIVQGFVPGHIHEGGLLSHSTNGEIEAKGEV